MDRTGHAGKAEAIGIVYAAGGMPGPQRDPRAITAWALYDVGNSAFATTVMAGFFPLFFKQYWCEGATAAESTFRLGLTSSLASAVVAVLAPLLGAVSDHRRARKKFLAGFGVLGAASTMGLALVGQGGWLAAALLFALGTIGFACSIVFYDSLLVAVADETDSHRVSALGYSLGYLGGGVLFALNVAMTLSPQTFGLADKAMAVRASFLLVGVWWIAFMIPLLRRVEEPRASSHSAQGALPRETPAQIARASFSQVAATLRAVRQTRALWMFLLAYWLYIDGVDTVIRMAVDYGLSLGLPSSSLIIALLVTQFVGFPAALVCGRIAGRFGEKRTILGCLTVYVGVTAWGSQMETVKEFYALAIAIGLVQGGVQALSRSMWSRMVPPERAAELFGFYNMLGKMAAIVGPILMGGVALLTQSTRLSILSVTVLFVAGGALLSRVPQPARK